MPLCKVHFEYTMLTIMIIFISSNGLGQNVKNIENQKEDIHHFVSLIYTKDSIEQSQHLHYIIENWKTEYEIMVLELAYLNREHELGKKLMDIINKETGQYLGYSFNDWYQYIWSKPQKTLANYDYFKAELYRQIDPRFERYFINQSQISQIRLDEIRWGGVTQDGIPPLRHPKMIPANEASYLLDDHIVFGVAINGDFRAYPKRILAWHELFTANIGGEAVTGVYCTLCGTVILYKSTKDGVTYDLETSGFLFRSNKLMYDQYTQSLWSTVWGKPVVGPLVGKGVQLDYLSVVITTWEAWKKQHPSTTVLSLNTGYKRDYDEGVAYGDYFANDQIMFAVPKAENKKIKNKQSILALRLQDVDKVPPVAISTKFLKKHPLYTHQLGLTRLVILTDKTGANRVYEIGDRHFTKYNPTQNIVLDNQGQQWTIHENDLKNDEGETLLRFHAYNAFWFGWQAAYPNTILIR